jgi:hypothetical protein
MRSVVIGLVLVFAVFTFVGALDQPGGKAPLEASAPATNLGR